MSQFKDLYQELTQAKILLPEYDSVDQLLVEADYSLRPHMHENRIVSYGFMSVDSLARMSEHIIILPEKFNVSQARSIADGKNLFVVIEDNHYAGLLVLSTPLLLEQEVVAFQKRTGGLICITEGNGITKFVSGQGISLHELRNWKFKPNVQKVASDIICYAPMANRQQLVSILEFCLHTLGANKIGATLAWFLDTPNPNILSSQAHVQTDIQPLNINLFDNQNLSALQSILDRNDGAALVSPDGAVFGVGAHLVNSQNSVTLIQAYAGTRHTSARRFSYDRPETILFTVSSDGPVSIFSDGLKIGELLTYNPSDIEQWYRSVSPDPDAVESSSWEENCQNCGKTSRVDEILIYGWREHETVDCPLCGSQIAARKCWQLNAQLIKRF